ncbi:MAG TPA: type VI secretion system membrane subunit TssM [Noviherbaspirillum sp.]|jgi:type VI secretion system protein ImpL|uniref:type VI secretion system membrane subunit TssM n=1 Tax=Noviherbaspirillum sp. TaxID=1926288 RepID=UPI002DDD26D5|nr:type VI secretion system membrane subunit TssM [Noviherbaspirillum sp.]HEV2609614.1 type VI secretion system membrane subunit TssM [Noviherbaspirillum sp.]
MKRLFSWIIKPWVLSLLGVLLLSLIVWFEAPLLAFDGVEPFASEGSRWALIGVLFVLWIAYFVWKYIAAKLANLKLMKGIAGDGDKTAPRPGANESAAEVAALGKRMQEAMQMLRKARLGGKARGQYMYQLPWYMFVGAPGSGKTTTLTQSGLKFPLSEALGKNAITGVGGTRNCDWWFTDEAVLLDTAGRYTTQDSFAEVDKAAWEGFLQLLKKHRRRRPINGVIVALSVADLLQQTDSARRAQALAIRERIKELHERLGIRFPIYIMVTKCDLLAGFVEFFDNLGREERAQVWGISYPLAEADQVDSALTAFPAEFQALESQLQARVLERMQHERDLQRRALIYGFPQQFAAIGDVLGTFLGDVFQSTRYEEKAMLRGVYFTSGTQEGSPIDRVMGSLAAAFGLDRQVLAPNEASGRSYFITRLLREVIFQEAELAGADLRFERKRKWLQWGAIGALASLLIITTAGLATSYLRNRSYVADVATRVEEIQKLAHAVPAKGNPVSTLKVLDAARDLPGGYADRDNSAPLLMTLGLYQGDKLGAGAQAAYRNLLRDTLLPKIVERMEDQLRRGSANSPEYLYELLRVYLMLGDRKHFDARAVRAWIDYDWQRNLSDANETQRLALSSHVAALLEGEELNTAVPLDAMLVADTRLILARMPLAQWIYDRVKRDMARSNLPEFNISSAGGRDVLQVFVRRSGQPLTRGVPGMYTLAGYQQFIEQSDQAIADMAKDSWVLAKQESVADAERSAQLKASVQQLYFVEYIKQWDDLLADVGIVPFTSLDQGARVMAILGGPDSPLRNLLKSAARETMLDAPKPKSATDTAANAIKGKLDAYKKKLEAALATDLDGPAPVVKSNNPVDLHFSELHKLVASAGPNMAMPLDQLLAAMMEVSAYFDAAESARRTGTPPPPADALAKLKREGSGKPPMVGALVQNVDSNGSALTLGTERARLNALWSANVAPFCKQAIAGRYPVVRKATEETTPDDFGKFFAPGGLIDDFFQKNLLPYVDMTGGQWRWRSVGAVSLDLPQDVLADFQRAARIRDAFFVAGGKQPSMRFELRPVSADPKIAELLLEVEGQSFTYEKGGPADPASFQLPSGKPSRGVFFDVTPEAAGPVLKTEGPWAWFRMIDKGVIEPTAQGERFKLTYDLQGRKFAMELSASSVINPFRRDALEQFRCLDKL